MVFLWLSYGFPMVYTPSNQLPRVLLPAMAVGPSGASQERLEDWEKYLTAVQDVVDVWLKAGRAIFHTHMLHV